MRTVRSDRLARSLLSVAILSSFASIAWSDGGAVRFSGTKGSYRITVFTAPAPLRAGFADVSVLVQDAKTGELASDVRVVIAVARRESNSAAIEHFATSESATNKLYQSASVDLPEPGGYGLDVSVAGPRGTARVHLELEAGDALPASLALWPWYAWPFAVILLFGIHQALARRLAGPADPVRIE